MNQIISKLAEIVGPSGILLGDDVSRRPGGWGSQDSCKAAAIIRPVTTEQVSQVLETCYQARQPLVPLGGMTGLVEGGLAASDEIILSLERMREVEEIDETDRTITVQAGVPLQMVQESAERVGLMFPLDLGARGSATIGGNIATNAGGNSVIRYGMMREQVLGIEAVLADGTVVSSMNRMIKNNAGYDLKQLFIGSEGTLGIVTRAVLRLRPQFQSENTALIAVRDFSSLTKLLRILDAALGGSLSSFEVMWNDFYAAVLNESSRHQAPLPQDYPYYVIVEAQGADQNSDDVRFETALKSGFDSGLVEDATIAQSKGQREAIWAIRDDIEGLMSALTPMFTFDVSLQLKHMEDYLSDVRNALEQLWPEVRCVIFGHLGDGNLHLVISVGSAEQDVRKQVEGIIYDALREHRGSISAEHGIGLEKRAYLDASRSENEIALMKTLKQALDPRSILNPGKVFTVD